MGKLKVIKIDIHRTLIARVHIKISILCNRQTGFYKGLEFCVSTHLLETVGVIVSADVFRLRRRLCGLNEAYRVAISSLLSLA